MYSFKLKHHKAVNTNLLNPDKVTQGNTVSDLGVIYSNPFSAYSAYIPVAYGATYKVNFVGSGIMYAYCYFDINKKYFPGGVASPPSNVIIVPSEPEIKYIIISFTSLSSGLDPVNISLSIGGTSNTNLLNPDKVTQGNTVSDLGVIYSNPFSAYSAYIPVAYGATYKVNFVGSGIMYAYCYFDINKKYFPGGVASPPSNVIIVPSEPEIKYIIISFTSLSSGLDPVNISLSIGGTSGYELYFESKSIHPIYKTLGRDNEKQSDYQFYREKLNGDLVLINKEYDYLNSLVFDQEVFLEITDLSVTLPIFKGKFFKTDCKWSADDRRVEIKIDTDDDYEVILGSLDKTFNLIQLAPRLEEVTIRKRPIIQVYIAGDNSITNLLGGTYWEQPIQIDPEFDHSVLINTYKFANPKNIRIIPSDYGPMLSTDVTDEYNASRISLSGLYKITEELDAFTFPNIRRYRYSVRRVSDNVQLYVTDWTFFTKPSINYLPFVGVGGETGTFYFTEYRIYVRIYTDALTVFSPAQNTQPIPSTDIVENNDNYRRIIGYDIDSFQRYDQFTTVSSKFGKVPDGTPDTGKYYKEYLVDPGTVLSNPLPISSSNWRAVSLWFFGSFDTRHMEFVEGSNFQLRDGYPIGSVIKVLLRAIETTVLFEETEEYSKVLYAETNPVNTFTYLEFEGDGDEDMSYSGNLNFLITPKSNLVVGNYDQPARKADVTLGQVLNMLRDTLKIYWHVENGKLRLEHIAFYQNGGAYGGTKIIGADLTTLTELKTQKNWSFALNKWEFDKANMPERYEFAWMDSVSPPFQGYPVLIRSNVVQKGRIENISVNGVTTDVDFIMSNPGAVSKDGFVLIGAVVMDDGSNRIPFIKYNLGSNKEIIMQNGFLSWPYLHYTFYSFDFPSGSLNINGVDLFLSGVVSRYKKQEVVYPFQSVINPYKLVKTGLGDGQIEKISINMESLIIKATIKHDTE